MPTTSDWFALAAGAFAAGVVAPPATVALALLDVGGPWYWWLALGTVTGFLGGVGSARATVSLETAERFRDGWHVGALFALPVGLGLGGLAVFVWTDVSAVAVWSAVAAGSLLVFAGVLGMNATASKLYADRVVGESTVRLALPPTESDRTNETVRGLLAAAVVLVAATVVGFWFLDDAVPWFVLFAALPAAVQLLPNGQDRYVVDAGVEIEAFGGRTSRIEPWAEFDGYALTDDELRIERASRWQRDLAFPRDEVDDVDAVAAVLDEHLPRTEASE